MYLVFGSLGCGIGYGYLHRIPIRSIEPDKKALLQPARQTPVPEASLSEKLPPQEPPPTQVSVIR